MSHVKYHVSHVSCHMSGVTCHESLIYFFEGVGVDKVLELVGGGSVINKPTPHIILLFNHHTFPTLLRDVL